MTFPANVGPDGGWSLAHDGGGRTFSDFRGDVSGTNHAGTISFSGGGVEAQTYGAFRSITASRMIRGSFYVNLYESGAITGWDGAANVQIDDGDANDHTILTSTTGTNLPSNFICFHIAIDEDATSVRFTPAIWYREGAGTVTSLDLSSVGDLTYSRTKPDETDIWVGFKFELTDTSARVWIDKNNNSVWNPLITGVEWTSPFSSTPFNQVRIMTSDQDGATDIQVGMDTVVVDSLVLTSEEITDKLIADSIIATNATRGGGQLKFKYKDPWLADFATVEALHNATLNVTNKSVLPFSKYIVVEIRPNIHDYDFDCHQVARELESYPCNHNPLTHTGIIGEITQYTNVWKLSDRDAAFGDLTTLTHYLSFGDLDKKRVRMEPAVFSIVEESDLSTPYTTADSITPVADTKEGDATTDLYWQDDTVVTVAGNMIGGYEYNTVLGGTDDYAIFLQARIHIKENATLLSAKLRLDHYHNAKAGFIVANQRPTVQIYDFTNTVWVTLKTVSDAEMDSYKQLTATGGATLWPTVVGFNRWEFDIGTEIVDYLDANGAVNSQGFQQWNIHIATTSGVSLWWGTGNYGTPDYLKYADLEITTTEENFITQGIGKVSSNTTTVITLDNTFDPSPAEDGVVRGDQYFVSKGRPDILTDIWPASGADSLFTLDNGLAHTKGDGIDYTFTMVATVLNKYADLEGFQWWQDNDPDNDYIRIKTPEDSGIVFTEATNSILDYINTGLSIRGTTKYMRNKIRVTGAYNSFHEETLSPASSNNRIEQYDKPELVTSDQCKTFAEQRKSYHEAIQYQGSVPYIWTGELLNVEVGNTVGVKIGAGGNHDHTDATGTGNLFVKEISIIQSANKIRATATVTTYFVGIEEG